MMTRPRKRLFDYSVLLVVYLTVAALVAYWPVPVDSAVAPWLTVSLETLHAHGVPGWLDYGLVEFLANIVFFVPLAVLLTLLMGRARSWFAVLIAVAASMSIEVGQLIFVSARFATLTDVAANSIGAAIGAGIAVFATRRVQRVEQD